MNAGRQTTTAATIWKRFIDRQRSAIQYARVIGHAPRRRHSGLDMQQRKANQLRSWMFVPGNRDRFIQKAYASTADAILLDIEDGVLPAEKADARRMIAQALRQPEGGPVRYVRVNALTTPWLKQDLDAVVGPGLAGICLTKVVTAKDVLETATLLHALEAARGLEPGSLRILAAVESARGILNSLAIADAHPRIVGLMFGAEDYSLDLGLGTRREKEAAELIFARSHLVNAATAANVLSIDGVFPNLDDPDGLLSDVMQARRLGFTSKSTFNPRQLDVINRLFSPQPDEIEYARKIAAAFKEAEARGDASVAVGGHLVDRHIVLRALGILESVGVC
jgi:citrate lyase subunit beta/citryl-CoA lyase